MIIKKLILSSCVKFKNNVELKKDGAVFKYFLFLTILYSYTNYKIKPRFSFVKAAKKLKNDDIYRELYFSNYFHNLDTNVFDKKTFNNDITIKKEQFKEILDNFWLLAEKDVWFKENKAKKLLNGDNSYSEKWNEKIILFLQQQKQIIKSIKKIFIHDNNKIITYVNKILNRKH